MEAVSGLLAMRRGVDVDRYGLGFEESHSVTGVVFGHGAVVGSRIQGAHFTETIAAPVALRPVDRTVVAPVAPPSPNSAFLWWKVCDDAITAQKTERSAG